MGNNCLDCHKPWGPFEVRGESPTPAIRKPGHYCTCTVSLFTIAKEHPQMFASGYDNQREWQERFLPDGHEVLSSNASKSGGPE